MNKIKNGSYIFLIFVFFVVVTGNDVFLAKAKPDSEDLMTKINKSANFQNQILSENTSIEERNEGIDNFQEYQYTTIEEAVKKSIEKNGRIQSMKKILETKKVNLHEKKDAASRIDEDGVKNLDVAKVKYYLPFDAEKQVEIVMLEKEEEENAVALEAIYTYLDVLYFQEAVDVLEAGVQRAQEQVDIARLNYEVGTITKVDVLSSEVQLEETQSELRQVQNNLQAKKMQLNQLMGQPLLTSISVSDISEDFQVPLGEEGVMKGLDYNLSIKKQQLELQSLNKLLEVTKNFYPKHTYAYQAVDASRMTKQAMLDETISKVELGIRSEQNLMDSFFETYKVMEQQVRKVQETYDIMLLQYKAGLISYQDLANTDQLLKQTSLEELQAKLDYYKAVYEYQYMIGWR